METKISDIVNCKRFLTFLSGKLTLFCGTTSGLDNLSFIDLLRRIFVFDTLGLLIRFGLNTQSRLFISYGSLICWESGADPPNSIRVEFTFTKIFSGLIEIYGIQLPNLHILRFVIPIG